MDAKRPDRGFFGMILPIGSDTAALFSGTCGVKGGFNAQSQNERDYGTSSVYQG